MSKSRETRTKEEAVGSTSNMVGALPPGWNNWGPETVTYLKPSFVTTKEIVTDSAFGRLEWHAFSHYRKDMHLDNPIPIRSVSWPDWQGTTVGGIGYRWGSLWEFPVYAVGCSFGPLDQPDFGLPSMYSVIDGELVIAPPLDLDSLLFTATSRMMPGIKAGLSVLNSLYELKDMKTLLHTASSLRDTVQRLANYKNPKTGLTAQQAYGRMTLREANRRGTSEYLQYKFNLAPLLSDIAGFINSCKNYKKQVKHLLSQADRVNRRHYTLVVTDGQTLPEESGPALHAYNVALPPQLEHYVFVQDFRQVEMEPVKLHVEMEYSYSISEYERLHANSLALMDSLGINLNPQIIWNAIPWSFVIDWVMGIGPMLGRLKIPGLQPVINIRRSCWSIKRTRHIRMSLSANNQQKLPSSRVTETAYRRAVFTPTMNSLTVSGLSPTEISLGYALASQRGRGLKRAHIRLKP
jgi:hypothetical protein